MSKKRKLLQILLQEGLEDDKWFYETYIAKRNPHRSLFQKHEGAYQALVQAHLINNPDDFVDYFRISISQFDDIVSLVKDDLKKTCTTTHPTPISPAEKCAITLR